MQTAVFTYTHRSEQSVMSSEAEVTKKEDDTTISTSHVPRKAFTTSTGAHTTAVTSTYSPTVMTSKLQDTTSSSVQHTAAMPTVTSESQQTNILASHVSPSLPSYVPSAVSSVSTKAQEDTTGLSSPVTIAVGRSSATEGTQMSIQADITRRTTSTQSGK